MGTQRNFSRRSFLELAGVAAMFGLAGCGTYTDGGSGGSAATGTPQDSFTIIGTQPNTLNMIQSQSNLDSYCFYLTQEMLFRPYDGKWSPEVVDSFEVDDTKTVYTYHLKETTWSDGTPVTAADFAYYLTAQLDPANASPNAALLISRYHFKGADKFVAGQAGLDEVGIKATDDKTLVLTLDRVVADFDGTNICVYPLQKAFVEQKGQALGGTAEDYMCSGPYTLDEWVFDSHLTYTKSDAYLLADEKFKVKTINWLEKNDDNAAVTMFEGGDADAILQVSSASYDQLKDYVKEFAGGDVKCVELNFKGQGDAAKAKLLSNESFRLALSWAIDRESVCTAASSLVRPVNRFFFDPLKGNSDDTTFDADYPLDAVDLKGDADKAKGYLDQALKELGYSSVADLPALGYLTFDADEYKKMAELLVDQWKQVLGITSVTIELKPIPDAIQLMATGQYDMYFQSLANTTMGTPTEFAGYWTSTGSINDIMGTGDGLWSSPEYDSLVDQASRELDRSARMALYAKAEQLLLDGGPLIPIDTSVSATALASGVSGFMANASDNAVELDELSVTK